MDKTGKLFFVITLPKIGILVKDGTQLIFDMYCAVNSLKLKVRTVFQNVWTNTMAIPIYRVLPYPVIDNVACRDKHSHSVSQDLG